VLRRSANPNESGVHDSVVIRERNAEAPKEGSEEEIREHDTRAAGRYEQLAEKLAVPAWLAPIRVSSSRVSVAKSGMREGQDILDARQLLGIIATCARDGDYTTG
jgi:hypothetical protein